MDYALSNGQAARLSATRAKAAILGTLKTISTTCGSNYALLAPAGELDDNALQRVRSEIEQADGEIAKTVAQAKALLAAGDGFTVALQQGARFIREGGKPPVGPLAKSLQVLRSEMASGDSSGIASATADCLESEAEKAANVLLECADYLRKYLDCIELEQHRAKAALLGTIAGSAKRGLVGAVALERIQKQATDTTEHAERLHRLYRKRWFETKERTAPVLQCTKGLPVIRTNKSFIVGGAA